MLEGEMPQGFVYVSEYVRDAIEQMRYAVADNFTGRPVDGYLRPRAILTRPAAEALSRAAEGFRKLGYRLLIFDAYRPQRAVNNFLRWAADLSDTLAKDKYYPEIADKADILKNGFVAAKSGHSRGSTIDLTLAFPTGDPLPMGTGFDCFGPRAAHGAQDIAPEETAARALLCRGMIEAGFKPYDAEWWHYTLINEPFPQTYFDFPVA